MAEPDDDPGEPPRSDLFDRMVAAGHATFTLATITGPPLSKREQDLVKAAIEAGVLGALVVQREDTGHGNEPV